MKKLLVAINSKYIHSNLAIHSLSAYAGAHKINVDCAEYTINQDIGEIIRKIYIEKPDFLAFSTYIWNVDIVKKVAVEIKKLLKNVVIWAGGPEVSYDAVDFLNKNPAFEGVVRGEGEETFCQLVKSYENGTGQDNIQGITFRCNDGIRQNADRAYMDMDSLPFVYDDISPFKNKIIYYESSRGCPFGCTYCLSCLEKKVRFRSLLLVKKELKYFLDAKVPQVKFVDRTFNCDKKRTEELLQFLVDNDNGVTNFHFEIAADLITEEQLAIIEKMRPGLIQMEIGVQSTNDDTIRAINRTMKLDALKSVVGRLNAMNNVHLHLDLIAGLPYEDFNTFTKSFNDVYNMEPEQLQLGFLKVLKGSPMYDLAACYGIICSDYPPYEVMQTNWITYGEILKLKQIEEMVETYYNSGQYSYSMRYLNKYYEAPYNLYEALAQFYEEKGCFDVKNSRIRTYELLHQFVEQNFKEHIEEFEGILLFDLYLRENLKSRPSFSKEPDESKKQYIRQLYRQFNVPKTGHIEQINGTYIIFDYEKRNPLNYQAKVTRIDYCRGQEKK
ncbi:MAG: B12-binding domain-containing radical SAM protein [Lachnospiraceae bacterium]